MTTGGGTVLFDPKNIIIAEPGVSQYSLVLGYNYTSLSGLSAALEAGDTFGAGVSLDGNRLVVGADGDDGFGNTASDVGTVYLFTFADTAFNNPKLEGIIGKGYTGGKNFDLTVLGGVELFGYSVSLNGTRLAVGAPHDSRSALYAGAVYLFTFADTAFSSPTLHVALLGPPFSDDFGASVSLDGTRLAVGAPHNDGAVYGSFTGDSGAVYLFTFVDTAFSSPTLQATIGKGYMGGKNFDLGALEEDDQFGFSVSLDGTRLAVGASYEDGNGNITSQAGAVYLFTFADTAFSSPTLQATIGKGYTGGKNFNLTGLGSWDLFGRSVSLDGMRLAVGAELDDGSGNIELNVGAVHLFTFADSLFNTPTLEATIGKGYTGGKNFDLSALGEDDRFGYSVSLDGMRLAVGAERDDGAENMTFSTSDFGAVYLFKWSNDPGNDPLTATFATDSTGNWTISPSGLASLLATPQNVTLQANNDITINSPVLVNNPLGNGGSLTLQAGRSILLNANITTDNGNLTLIADETAANGVIASQRDAGTAAIMLASGVALNTGTGTLTQTPSSSTTTSSTSTSATTSSGSTSTASSSTSSGTTSSSASSGTTSTGTSGSASTTSSSETSTSTTSTSTTSTTPSDSTASSSTTGTSSSSSTLTTDAVAALAPSLVETLTSSTTTVTDQSATIANSTPAFIPNAPLTQVVSSSPVAYDQAYNQLVKENPLIAYRTVALQNKMDKGEVSSSELLKWFNPMLTLPGYSYAGRGDHGGSPTSALDVAAQLHDGDYKAYGEHEAVLGDQFGAYSRSAPSIRTADIRLVVRASTIWQDLDARVKRDGYQSLTESEKRDYHWAPLLISMFSDKIDVAVGKEFDAASKEQIKTFVKTFVKTEIENMKREDSTFVGNEDAVMSVVAEGKSYQEYKEELGKTELVGVKTLILNKGPAIADKTDTVPVVAALVNGAKERVKEAGVLIKKATGIISGWIKW
ncbi:MAG: FG-GAP repeat protein [Verrucomicrobia bacterium]|nr:FG-GAP repeat protein [Verrucomicrobiota bacterium]